MIHIQEDNLDIMYSENIPYLRVELSGFLTPEQYRERLSNEKIFSLAAEKRVGNLLLNLTRTHRFGTEELEWITKTWLARAAIFGIRRVSVVVQKQVYDLFKLLFDAAAGQVDKQTIEARFFHDNQFYDGWESVAWFQADEHG
ncbi:MAG TPA: hypothetical protein VNO70_00515 [Blastocatellia bacterium]|nr:hypothetical protein [Blastocatellia bacterium]